MNTNTNTTNTTIITQMIHCLEKIEETADRLNEGRGSDRDILQLGYNAGRLAELSGEGRIIWDKLKDLVEGGLWDRIIHKVWEWRPEVRAGLPMEPKESE
jgi:hypothetical protein